MADGTSTRQNPLLAAALSYAARGWPVFALQPNSKIPFGGTHGARDATTDEQTIREWWERWPRFFFSSRRRHTSWTGDWSSDLCSSDLHRLVNEGPSCELDGMVELEFIATGVVWDIDIPSLPATG